MTMLSENPQPASRHGHPNSTESITLGSLALNHPKNYLTVPLAMKGDAPRDELIRDHAVGLPDRAVRGAIELGLMSGDETLTELGESVVVTAIRIHETIERALTDLESLRGSSRRFIDARPEWESTLSTIILEYPLASRIVRILREQGSCQLYELAWTLWKDSPNIAQETFLTPPLQHSDRTFEAVTDAGNYHGKATYQFKALLYHAGILSKRGAITSTLDPVADEWQLTDRYR